MPRDDVNAAALRELWQRLSEPPRQRPSTPVGLDGDVLTLLKHLIPADLVTFNDLAPQRQDGWVHVADTEFDLESNAEESNAEDDEIYFWDHFWSSPCSYSDRTGDWDSVTRISDFASLKDWRSSAMYVWGCVDREMIMPLPSFPGHSRRVRWLRMRGRDFDDTDVALADFVRPHLVAHLQARDLASQGVAPLTTRQRQLLNIVASGRSNAQAARALGITTATVRTHLQLIYSRLGVASRGEAVALVFPSAPQPISTGRFQRSV